MARYIDADKLYKRVKEKTNPYGKPTLDYESGLKVLGMIEQELTADVVEVPCRCSECKHLKIINKEPVYAECVKQKLTFLLWEADTREHSCSYGERKENETSDS